MMPPSCVVAQLSFEAILVLLESKISRVGSATASAIPKGISDGPIARTRIFLIEPPAPWTMNPSISALSPVPTGRRVEMLATKPGVGVAVPTGVAVAVGATVAVGVAVGAGVGVGDGGALQFTNTAA